MKAVKEYVRKYYKWASWTQPVMSANTQNDITLSATNFSSNNLYTLMNGVSNSDYLYPTTGSSYGSVYRVKFENPIRLKKFTLNYYVQTNETYGFSSFKAVAMEGTNEIVLINLDDIWTDNGWRTKSVDVDNIITNNIVIYCSKNGDPPPRIGEITVEADIIADGTSSDYDFYEDIPIYKMIKENVRKYYKYDWETAFSPIFYSQTEATEGIDGVKIINNAGYYYLTQSATHTISRGNTITFDMGEASKGITSIGFTGIVSPSNYPSLVMSNVQCSEDNLTWITIASSYGGRNAVYTNPLTITTPNNYRYIRFTTSVDDGDYSQGGCQSLTVGYNKRIVINGTPNDYNFYKDADVYKALKSYEKGQYYGGI